MDPIKVTDLSTLGDTKGEITIDADKIRDLMKKVSDAEGLQAKLEKLDREYDQVSSIALAGLELARKDVTPDEVRRHMRTLYQADGSYSDEEISSILEGVGKSPEQTPKKDPSASGGTEETPVDEQTAARIQQLENQLKELKDQTSEVNSLSSHANAQIMRDRMEKAIGMAVNSEKFAGGVVSKRRKMYAEDADKLSSFDTTVSKQVEAATLGLIREQIRSGVKPSELNIEALVQKASSNVGGTLQTVIGEDISPLTATVAGESEYQSFIEDLGDVKDVTHDQLDEAGSPEQLNKLVDQQQQSNLNVLMRAAEAADKTSNSGKEVV